MGTLQHDLKSGIRLMRSHPGMTCLATLILGIGIAANTVVFSALHAVILAPLPFEHPHRIMSVWSWTPDLPFPYHGTSVPDYADWVEQNEVFEELAALSPRWLTLTGKDEPLALTGWAVTSNYFAAFESPPLIGRAFTISEEKVGNDRVAILSHSLWINLFSADPDISRQRILLDGEPHTIVGVARPEMEFRTDFRAMVYVPFVVDPGSASRGERGNQVVGRLKPGVSSTQALAAMRTIARNLEQGHPDTNRDVTVKIIPLKDLLFDTVRWTLVVIYGAVAFFLLLACVNAAGLLLVQSNARRRETAIRSALGASRGRLIRQFLTESVMLTSLAASIGLLMSIWGIDLMDIAVSWLQGSGGISGAAGISLNSTALGFCLIVSVATGLLCGIVPALRSIRIGAKEALADRSGEYTPGQLAIFNKLVVCEIAVASVLLVGAGLMVRSFAMLSNESPGFDAERLVGLELRRPDTVENQTNQPRVAFVRAVLETIRSLPGAVSAGTVSIHPMSKNNLNTGFAIEGRPALPEGQAISAEYRTVSSGYFSTMKMPLLRGRLFTDHDDGDYPVAIINEELARRHFPDGEPIGARLDFDGSSLEIVGVVGNTKYRGLASEDPEAFIYEPIDQYCLLNMTVLVRTAGDPRSLVDSIRRAIWSVDPTQPILKVHLMRNLVSETMSPLRLGTVLLSATALLGLLLAVAGVYGMMSFMVSQRRHEIGIRIALGAGMTRIVKMIVSRGMALVSIGAVLGLTAAFALSRALQSMLYGITPTDLPAYLAGILIVWIAAIVACYLPARRATRSDPMATLRNE